MEKITKKIFVSDLTTKEEVEDIFLVKLINALEDKTGRKYFNIILMDSTGDLEARLWQYSTDVEESVTKNSFVRVRGKVNYYQGRKQFIISQIFPLDSTLIDKDDFIMKSQNDPEKMYQDLLNIVSGLTDVYIKSLLENILSDQEISRRLKTWQAGKSIHHAYQSGLIEHILSCSHLALTLSEHYKVNVNYVVAGCILHDLCKIYELSDGVNVEYTEEGKLVGHLVKGLEIVDRFSYRIKNFPYQLKIHLKHILLSHHGEYEFGSPKVPLTSEAYLVHLIDLMDSKMGALHQIKKLDNNPGHWSGYVKHLDRTVYKAELPYFSEFQDEDHFEGDKNKKTQSSVSKNTSKKTFSKDSEPKTKLGSMLQDFKLS